MKKQPLLIIASLLLAFSVQAAEKIKLGYVVKQPDEPWFQMEWKFAQKCADDHGFELIKIGATDGEKMLSAIDSLAANGARGFVCVSPDVRLGPAIAMKAKQNNLKLLTNADQLVGADGNFMPDVPFLGIAARKIGNNVGNELWREMQKRNWPLAEVGLCVVTFDELDTVKERYEGAVETLLANGFPKEQVYRAPIMQVMEIPTALNAVNILLTKYPNVKYWLIAGGNDSCVLGAVRAMEGRNFKADNVIGIGINGTDCIAELEKTTPTGFFGSMMLSARQHGYGATEMLYNWVKNGEEPPKDSRTEGIFINRANFKQVLKEEGIID